MHDLSTMFVATHIGPTFQNYLDDTKLIAQKHENYFYEYVQLSFILKINIKLTYNSTKCITCR